MKTLALLPLLCLLGNEPIERCLRAADLPRVLLQIKPGDLATLDAAENELAADGPAGRPQLHEALEQKRLALGEPAQRPWAEVQRLKLEVEVLDSAETFLRWGVRPRAILGQFLAKLPVAAHHEWIRGVRPVRLDENALPAVFPEHQFYVLHYSAYPVGRPLPEPLRGQNILILSKTGALEHITDATALERVLRPLLPPARDPQTRTNILCAWLRITLEFSQDTLFGFSIPPDSVQVVADGEGWKASGKAVVKPSGGNQGDISVILSFDSAGKLRSVAETRAVRAGIRPRCQATKLLDADPVVRAMAEQDILVMGRAGTAYLAERHRLAQPELQAAIEKLWQQILAEGR